MRVCVCEGETEVCLCVCVCVCVFSREWGERTERGTGASELGGELNGLIVPGHQAEVKLTRPYF